MHLQPEEILLIQQALNGYGYALAEDGEISDKLIKAYADWSLTHANHNGVIAFPNNKFQVAPELLTQDELDALEIAEKPAVVEDESDDSDDSQTGGDATDGVLMSPD